MDKPQPMQAIDLGDHEVIEFNAVFYILLLQIWNESNSFEDFEIQHRFRKEVANSEICWGSCRFEARLGLVFGWEIFGAAANRGGE